MRKYIKCLLSFLIFFLSNLRCYGKITIGPYIQNVTEKTAVICWRTSSKVPGAVKIWKSKDKFMQFEGEKSKIHKILISNLSPGALYYYQVISGSEKTPKDDRSYFFRTAAQKGEPFTFAVYADTMRNRTSFNKDHHSVVESIINFTKPQLVLHLGDLVNNPKSEDDWENFFLIESKLLRNTPIYPIHGMNEGWDENFSSFFILPNNKLWYSFDWGDCHFIALNIWDSRKNYLKKVFSPTGEQYKWFISDLESKNRQNAKFTIVYLHQPIFLFNGGDNEELKKILHPILKKYKVDLVFSSKHLFEHSEHEGIRYVVTGGGGAEIFTNFTKFGTPCIDFFLKFHHCRVKVTFSSLVVEAVSPEGTILSSLNVEK